MSISKLLFCLGTLAVCSTAFADVTLQGIAGGDVVMTTINVTLPSVDFFYVTFDGGSPSVPAPAWLSAAPTAGYTNLQVQILADPANRLLIIGSPSRRMLGTWRPPDPR